MTRAVPPGFLICVAVNIARDFEALSRDALPLSAIQLNQEHPGRFLIEN